VQPDIKAFLEAIHGLHVEKVSTINYQGKEEEADRLPGQTTLLQVGQGRSRAGPEGQLE
jgi:ribosomal protein L23